MEGPLQEQTVEKAILVESKRLYPVRNQFSLGCRYEAFKLDQLETLWNLDRILGWGFVYYFPYNPTLAAFDQRSSELIRAYENQASWSLGQGVDEREAYYLMRKFKMRAPFSLRPTGQPEVDREAQNERVVRRPGLRVLSPTSLKENKVLDSSQLRLEACYNLARSLERVGNRAAVPFPTLSEFVVDFFAACIRGSSSPKALAIASGQEVEFDAADDADDEPRRSILASHTLRITLTSTLSGDIRHG